MNYLVHAMTYTPFGNCWEETELLTNVLCIELCYSVQ